ncbi:hypothetical protein [Paracoccus sp. 08]|uniref:hypothetical protein n=1 Tax=Paracoccus sp. 08 TaxID=2606624 RepID=UPI0020960906|nr:hypothetical protein [Paracoccus sp. 08]MCO6364663.1 hypothetical protein [Paracoccus sp. 08]
MEKVATKPCPSYDRRILPRSSPAGTLFNKCVSVKQPAQGKVDFGLDHPLDLLRFATFIFDLLTPKKDRSRFWTFKLSYYFFRNFHGSPHGYVNKYNLSFLLACCQIR